MRVKEVLGRVGDGVEDSNLLREEDHLDQIVVLAVVQKKWVSGNALYFDTNERTQDGYSQSAANLFCPGYHVTLQVFLLHTVLVDFVGKCTLFTILIRDWLLSQHLTSWSVSTDIILYNKQLT